MSGTVGFVVIGRNEGERLVECLQSLQAASKRIMYSDSRSTDGSVERARAIGAETVVVEGAPTTAARGRNTGFAALRKAFPECDLVQFIDGDCILSEGWIEQARSFLADKPDVAVVCGRRFEAHPQASFYNKVIDDEWDTPIGRADACGGDALVRVSAFEEVGGFNADLIAGEEPDFCARLRAAGWQIWRLDAPMTRHDAAIHRLSQWMKRADRSGFGYMQVWNQSRGRTERMYERQIVSALIWGVAIPLAIILAAILLQSPLVLLAIPAIYLLQIARIAARKGIRSDYSWKYALLVVTAKLGEAKGVIRYLLTPRTGQQFDYKTSTRAEHRAA